MKSAHKIKTATIITTTTATSTRKQQEQQLTSGRAWAFDCRDRRKRVQMSNWAPKRTTKYLRGYKKSTTAVAVAARRQSARLLSCGPSLSFSLSVTLSQSLSLMRRQRQCGYLVQTALRLRSFVSFKNFSRFVCFLYPTFIEYGMGYNKFVQIHDERQKEA